MSAISNCFSCKQTAIENLILYGIPTSLVLTDLFYENLPEYVLYAAMLVPMAYKFGGDLADSATSDKTLSSRIAEAFKRQLCSKEILFSLTLLSMHHLGKTKAIKNSGRPWKAPHLQGSSTKRHSRRIAVCHLYRHTTKPPAPNPTTAAHTSQAHPARQRPHAPAHKAGMLSG